MRILSIDIGIKNLAYCLVDVDMDIGGYKIIQWDVLNLVDEVVDDNTALTHEKSCICSFIMKTGRKCGNRGMSEYVDDKGECQYLCNKHIGKIGRIILEKEYKNIKSKSKAKIEALCAPYIEVDGKKLSKTSLLSAWDNFIKTRAIIMLPVVKRRVKNNAVKVNMLKICHKINKYFWELFKGGHDIDKVLIENQIGRLACRMAIIQGVITQYFMDPTKEGKVEYISPLRKLQVLNGSGSGIAPEPEPVDNDPEPEPVDNDYKHRKKSSIGLCHDVLQNKSSNHEWLAKFKSHKKRDDLSDCFLQMLWYITENRTT